MKFNVLLCALLVIPLVTNAQTRADIIVQYEGADIELTTIGNIGDGCQDITDLEFHPDLSKNELWAISRRTVSAGSNTIIFFDTGEPSQTSIDKPDENNWHFMSLTTGIAFSEDNENFATSPGVYDANHDGGTPFTGPSLWSSDLSVYGEPSGGNGSHLDMLHESSYAQGICWETENVFWVYDGNIGDLVRYDFANDHGPGGSYHGDAKVVRWQGLGLEKDPDDNIPSHIVLDADKKWLYAVDHGNDRIIRVDITTGSYGGTPSYGPHESLAQYETQVDFTWEVIVDSGLVDPAGIALINNKILVSDHSNGDIIAYQTEGTDAFKEWFRIETGNTGITGLEIGPDGRIFYGNEMKNKVVRIDAPTLSIQPYESDFEVKIYPNPAHQDMVKIQASLDLRAENVSVYTPDGKEVHVPLKEMSNGKIELDPSTLSNGIYIVQISANDHLVRRRLLVD